MERKADFRHSARIHCRVPITLRTSDGRDISAVCLDVNRNGIGIESQHVFTVGQRLNLLVAKSKGDPSLVPMLVIYRMDKHYGLSALGAFEEVLNLLPAQS
jgi:hypothetical protein